MRAHTALINHTAENENIYSAGHTRQIRGGGGRGGGEIFLSGWRFCSIVGGLGTIRAYTTPEPAIIRVIASSARAIASWASGRARHHAARALVAAMMNEGASWLRSIDEPARLFPHNPVSARSCARYLTTRYLTIIGGYRYLWNFIFLRGIRTYVRTFVRSAY